MKNPVILAVQGGFYFFGDEVPPPKDGYVCLKSVAMFNGFEASKGLPGVARGDAQSKVTLDRFRPDDVVTYPESAVFAIMPSINLYEWKNCTCR